MKITTHCAHCGAVIIRTLAHCFVRGAKRNFCDHKCVSEFRKTQTGTAASRYSHGGKGTRLYSIWKGIKTRCLNPKVPSYHRYGGRGITICAEWKSDFACFRDWALEHGYADALEIDRINNDGNYEPSNCRFVTDAVNRKNNSTFKRTPDIDAAIRSSVADGNSYPKTAALLGISKSTVFRCMSDRS